LTFCEPVKQQGLQSIKLKTSETENKQ